MISLLGLIMVTCGEVAPWTPDGLERDLYPIAHLESTFGKHLTHKSHSRGEFWSSIGALGLKPITAYETYQKSPKLQKEFPGLHEAQMFLAKLKGNVRFYNQICNAHWHRLQRTFSGLERTVYGWRWGRTAAESASFEEIINDPYVRAYYIRRGFTFKSSHLQVH